jgi:hypothetical protein
MALKAHRSRVLLVLLRSAVFYLLAFLILRWAWSRGMLPAGAGIGALVATILIDLRRQVGKIDLPAWSDSE